MMMARTVLSLVCLAACAFAWPPLAIAQQVEDDLLDEADALGDEEEVDVSRIDQILRGDQDVREGGFVNYDDGGRRDPFRSLLDAVGTGIGFTIALVMMGGFREILGTGSFLGVSLFGPNFEPWVIMVLPAGGFLTLGFILLAMGVIEQRKKAKAEPVTEGLS